MIFLGTEPAIIVWNSSDIAVELRLTISFSFCTQNPVWLVISRDRSCTRTRIVVSGKASCLSPLALVAVRVIFLRLKLPPITLFRPFVNTLLNWSILWLKASEGEVQTCEKGDNWFSWSSGWLFATKLLAKRFRPVPSPRFEPIYMELECSETESLSVGKKPTVFLVISWYEASAIWSKSSDVIIMRSFVKFSEL